MSPQLVKPTEGDAVLKCPKDLQRMAKLHIQGVVYDHCAKCGSMWFDASELTRLRQSPEIAQRVESETHDTLNERQVVGQLHCPRDGSVLAQLSDPQQPHVFIDLCPTCRGVLLDAGELIDLSILTLGEKFRGFFRRT